MCVRERRRGGREKRFGLMAGANWTQIRYLVKKVLPSSLLYLTFSPSSM